MKIKTVLIIEQLTDFLLAAEYDSKVVKSISNQIKLIDNKVDNAYLTALLKGAVIAVLTNPTTKK